MTARSLAGRAAFVTGGSRGLGRAVACRFAEAGAHVAIVGRNRAALEEAGLEVKQRRADNSQIVQWTVADVLDEAAMVRALAAFAETAGPLTVLFNNAALLGPIGDLDSLDWTRWCETISVDLLAPINLCRLALPGLRSAGYGKIINVSGGGATAARPRFSAYATAKCGLVRFTETLAAELRGTGIDVNAMAPGAMNTRMMDEVVAAGPEAAGAEYHEARRRQDTESTPERAADLALFLASADSDGLTGRLLSAVWDPWEDLPNRRTQLDGSDIYTLRRIVPTDRGFTWGDR
jgi:NAD(P)-dependent dehydrogenase (short-subunit alcohol dehydrogenase family)